MPAHHKILGIVTMLYLALFFLHVLYFALRKEKILSVVWILFYITFTLHTVGILLRWLESYRLGIGHAPLSNFYESLIFYAWSVTGLLIVMKKRIGIPAITCLGSTAALVLMGFASLSPTVERSIEPLVPALQSNWLHIHVMTCFVAYAAFAVASMASILRVAGMGRFAPSAERLDEINYKSIIIGFPMLTSGILTGAVWAHYAWGSYWSWDPKETWSLITWIVYALFLHVRLKGVRGKKSAILSIVGFASVLVTYFVVNFILSGLHSYAR
ncbi:MAG TPA: cytochrome c biogenesis protein CcsA [Syntrophorhabdaceae bacterium]|nr:cytochrome c biogenesis protein CcsA [Syntrophorhabdaceae bacterium]